MKPNTNTLLKELSNKITPNDIDSFHRSVTSQAIIRKFSSVAYGNKLRNPYPENTVESKKHWNSHPEKKRPHQIFTPSFQTNTMGIRELYKRRSGKIRSRHCDEHQETRPSKTAVPTHMQTHTDSDMIKY